MANQSSRTKQQGHAGKKKKEKLGHTPKQLYKTHTIKIEKGKKNNEQALCTR